MIITKIDKRHLDREGLSEDNFNLIYEHVRSSGMSDVYRIIKNDTDLTTHQIIDAIDPFNYGGNSTGLGKNCYVCVYKD